VGHAGSRWTRRPTLAAVCLRQSDLRQMRNHTESTARQYALKQRATGWVPGYRAMPLEVVPGEAGGEMPLEVVPGEAGGDIACVS
jgi:hypothetical protein